MNGSTLEIRILDRVFHVSCPEDRQETLKQVAEHLNEEINAIYSAGKLDNLEQILVMVALNIGNELRQARGDTEDREILERIGGKIDQALKQTKLQQAELLPAK